MSRCVTCSGPMYRETGWAADALPRNWEQTGQCPGCILDGPPPTETAEARHEKLVLGRLEASVLPMRFWDARIGDLDAAGDREPVIDAAYRWARGEITGLFLTGTVGTGKTTIAAAACRALLERQACQWTSAPTLMAYAAADYHTPQHRVAQQITTRLSGLVLDDLGAERATDRARELLFAAIDSRIAARRPLLITSNLMPSELGARYGAWLASRLAGMPSYRVLGRDRRLETT